MHIPTWSLPYAIPARVIVPSDHRLGPQPWGPVFGIEPGFAKNTITVFGRRDFFRAFTVTFEHHSGPVLHLDDPGEVPTPIELD